MSLYKQLWFAIAFLMSVAFVGSLVVSSLSVKSYLEEQLSLKNIDNVNALALSIATTADDDVTTKLMIAAQFDTGHYQFIRLRDVDGNIIVENSDNTTTGSTPVWFTQLLKINALDGIAQIQRGWQQVGTLTLKSHDVFAYQALWRSCVRLFNYCLIISLIGGGLGTFLLKIILRPLDSTVAQAEAIGKRQFIIVDEPRTKEFKEVVRSMNSLSMHVKTMLDEESARLSRLQKGTLFDSVTHLPNREHFLNILAADLESNEHHSYGVLTLVRLQHLTLLNRNHGRQLMDLLLSRIGQALLEKTTQERAWQVGRLNGSDFALLARGEDDPHLIAHKIQETLMAAIKDSEIQAMTNLPTAASLYHCGEDPSSLLSKIDAALASAESIGDSAVEIADGKALDKTTSRVDEWELRLEQAFLHNNFSLASFPVINAKNQLLHNECPARLATPQGTLMNGGQFIPWINRFDFGSKLDEIIIALALSELASSDNHLAINLSAQALNNDSFLKKLVEKLSQQPHSSQRLWMEVAEHNVYQNLLGFKQFCQALKPLGCHIGIKHVGHHISQIGEIHDLGLDYIKIDSSFTRQVDSAPAHQLLLRGLCSMVHSVGLIAIAEGVQKQEQWKTLRELGVDGATGPMVTALLESTSLKL
ncbi:MAG: EAL domain-containing protein [Spongiibacteraceae bacterium]|nr:EAL domain-containing protein [Spongiibacteraceae bacterium]